MTKFLTSIVVCLSTLFSAHLWAQNTMGSQRNDLYGTQYDNILDNGTRQQNNTGECDSSCALGLQNLGPGNENIFTLKPPVLEVLGSQTQTLACSDGFTGSVVQQRFVYSNGGYGPWVETQNSCSCTGTQQQQTVACSSPLKGTLTQQRDFSCSMGVWSGWYNISSSCH